MGGDTSGCKEKTRKKSNDTRTERRPENTKTWENGAGESIGHKRVVHMCLRIKDRQKTDYIAQQKPQ